MDRSAIFALICGISLMSFGCSKEKTAEQKSKSCQRSIEVAQENAVCNAVLGAAFEYNKTGDTISCSGKDWSQMGLPFDIRRNLEIDKKFKDVLMEDCNQENIDKDLHLSLKEMKFIFEYKICNKSAKKDFLECRENLLF